MSRYRPPARIVLAGGRGSPARRRPDACPGCHRPASIVNGVLLRHFDESRRLCQTYRATTETAPNPDAVLAALQTAGPRPRKAPPPPTVRAARRPKPPDPLACPECGRRTPANNDGSLRSHRVRADDPIAPYCPAGRPKGTR